MDSRIADQILHRSQGTCDHIQRKMKKHQWRKFKRHGELKEDLGLKDTSQDNRFPEHEKVLIQFHLSNIVAVDCSCTLHLI